MPDHWDEKIMEELLLKIPLAVTVVSGDGAIGFSTLATREVIGHGPEEIVGKAFLDLIHPEDSERARAVMQRVMDGQGMPEILQARVMHGDSGTWIPISVRFDRVGGNSGENHGLLVAGFGRHPSCFGPMAERECVALKEREERFELSVRGTNDGLWDWDLSTGKVYYSLRWKSMLGCEEDEVGASPQEWFRRIHPEDAPSFMTKFEAHKNGASAQFLLEYRIQHKDGGYRWVLVRGQVVKDGRGEPCRMAGSQTDITERKISEERLLFDALHDALTNLPNRALFLDRLGQALARAGRRPEYQFALLFLDLDRFKILNDSLGHLTGDLLLVEMAHRLNGCLRSADTIARMGGDEFTMLLDDIGGVSDATQFATRVQEILAAPFQIGPHEVYTSASIGIALSSMGYERPEDILRDADTAMYRAKSQGRARYVVFDQSMHASALEQLEMEMELRKALEHRRFRIYYQPIVSLRSGRLVGFEALLRWPHPKRGFIPPSKFIHLAEETGLIVPLGTWLLRETCKQLKVWHDRFRQANPLTLSVNLSGVQLMQPDFTIQLEMLLRELGLDGRYLKLELTETILIEHAQYAGTMLQQIKSHNIRLCVDDFGMGYSSINYLRRYPIDTVKIDMSFVAKILEDPESAEIVRSIVAMAHNLEMDVVAEGVENRQQLQILKEIGCDYGQGYYYARAMDPDAAESLIASKRFW